MPKKKKAPVTPVEVPAEVPKEASQAPEAPKPVNNRSSVVKIDPKDIIQLQKDGKLMSYDPATGMGEVREKGLPTIWPSA